MSCRVLFLALALALLACGRRERAPVEEAPPAPVVETEPPMSGPLSAAWLRDLPAPSVTSPPRSVGGAPQIVGGYEDFLGSLIVDGDDVYVADSKREQPTQEVVLVPASGAARVIARTRALPPPFTEELFGIAADATHVFVTSSIRTHDASRVAYAVRSIPKAGGGAARVLARGDLAADGLATDLALSSTALYLLVRGDEPGVDPYVAAIARIATSQPADPVRVISNVRGHYPWAVGDGFIYHEIEEAQVAHHRPGTLVRTPEAGGTPQTIVHAEDSIGTIVLATSYVLYTQVGDKLIDIYRVPKTGGARELVATFDGFPAAIAVDHDIVYWAVLHDDLHQPAKLFARSIHDAKMPPARDTKVTLPRGPSWTVKDGILYVPRSNGVDRTVVAR